MVSQICITVENNLDIFKISFRMQTNRCGPETDPLTEAIKKDEYIMSTKDDVPPELRKLPIKVYLESLMRIYPDIITVS